MTYIRSSALEREVYRRQLWNMLSRNMTISANVIEVARVKITAIEVPFNCYVDKVLLPVENISAGNVYVGIYEDKGDTPLGGAVKATSVSTALGAGANELKEIPLTVETYLRKGLCWICVEASDATLTLFYNSYAVIPPAGGLIRDWYYNRAGGYGALTNPCPALTFDNTIVMGLNVSKILRA